MHPNPSDPHPCTAILVEDDDFTRATLAGALRDAGLDVLGEVGTAAEGLRLVRRLRPDAAILDLDLGRGPSGADLAAALRAQLPELGIVILTSYEDPRLSGRNLEHLPHDARYIVKSDLKSMHALASTVQAAVDAARRSSAKPPRSDPRPRSPLTDAQIDVVRLVAEGYSNAEIARQRHISDTSVERIITRAALNLGIESTSTHNRRVRLTRAYLEMTGGARPRD